MLLTWLGTPRRLEVWWFCDQVVWFGAVIVYRTDGASVLGPSKVYAGFTYWDSITRVAITAAFVASLAYYA